MRDLQGNVAARAQVGTERRPGIGLRADAVMDVQRAQAPLVSRGKLVQQVQQDNGINTAAQAQQDGTTLRHNGGERAGNALQQITRARLP